jgi:hypothetical protein
MSLYREAQLSDVVMYDDFELLPGERWAIDEEP